MLKIGTHASSRRYSRFGGASICAAFNELRISGTEQSDLTGNPLLWFIAYLYTINSNYIYESAVGTGHRYHQLEFKVVYKNTLRLRECGEERATRSLNRRRIAISVVKFMEDDQATNKLVGKREGREKQVEV